MLYNAVPPPARYAVSTTLAAVSTTHVVVLRNRARDSSSNSAPASAIAHASAASWWSTARAARRAASARPSWLRNSGFAASAASANIGTLPDARATISSTAPLAIPTATAANAIVDRHSSGIRSSVKSSSGGSKIENDQSSPTNTPSAVKS